MENIVLIAIITACASLLVAIISFIGVLLNSRNNSRTLESIERLKNEFVLSNRSRDILDSELKATLQNLKDSVQTIQNLRNEIQTLMLDKEIAIKSGVFERIRSSAKSVMSSYSNSHMTFSEIEKGAFHDAKKIATNCQYLAEKALRMKTKKDDFAEMEKIYNQFANAQTELLAQQRVLTDYRSGLLIGLSQGSLLYLNAKHRTVGKKRAC